MDYKQARNSNFDYTRQGSEDMEQIRELVTKAWKTGIDLGYSPHEIFYEIISEVNVEFLMGALSVRVGK